MKNNFVSSKINYQLIFIYCIYIEESVAEAKDEEEEVIEDIFTPEGPPYLVIPEEDREERPGYVKSIGLGHIFL